VKHVTENTTLDEVVATNIENVSNEASYAVGNATESVLNKGKRVLNKGKESVHFLGDKAAAYGKVVQQLMEEFGIQYENEIQAVYDASVMINPALRDKLDFLKQKWKKIQSSNDSRVDGISPMTLNNLRFKEVRDKFNSLVSSLSLTNVTPVPFAKAKNELPEFFKDAPGDVSDEFAKAYPMESHSLVESMGDYFKSKHPLLTKIFSADQDDTSKPSARWARELMEVPSESQLENVREVEFLRKNKKSLMDAFENK
jgi:hypothetical protein